MKFSRVLFYLCAVLLVIACEASIMYLDVRYVKFVRCLRSIKMSKLDFLTKSNLFLLLSNLCFGRAAAFVACIRLI